VTLLSKRIIAFVILCCVMGFMYTPDFEPEFSTGYIPLDLPDHHEPIGPFIDKFALQEQLCLSIAIYGEARGETEESMKAVAWVIVNRTNDIRFPNTICDVVLQQYQFESLRKGTLLHTLAVNAKHGIMAFPPMYNKWLANKIQLLAGEIVEGRSDDITYGATHFWSPTVQYALGRTAPSWSQQLAYKRDIGNHKFYQ